MTSRLTWRMRRSLWIIGRSNLMPWSTLKEDEHTAYCGTDTSLPANVQHQAASAYLIYRQGDVVYRARYIAGRVTTPDAELYAICAAIVKACSLPDVNNITLFTDSIASARRAVNPSVHSGQGHSLAVCRTLEQWFANGGRSGVLYCPPQSTGGVCGSTSTTSGVCRSTSILD